MKEKIITLLNKYLQIFPEEEDRLKKLIEYLTNTKDNDLVDWNNFNGHLVVGGFIYAKEDNKFLVLYHKDLKMYLYPGGHIDASDIDTLNASRREIEEETGLSDLIQLKICEDELVPIDIDVHMIPYNERLQLPAHYHFDFRYLFIVESISEVKTDTDEISNYKWITAIELVNDSNYGSVVNKIFSILDKDMV